ncbi:hypothetical protein D9M72_477820 [compost metagenome]
MWFRVLDVQVLGEGGAESGQLLPAGDEAVRADGQPHLPMPQAGEVLHRGADGRGVVIGNGGGLQFRAGTVDQDERDAAAAEPVVTLQAGLAVGV